MKNKNAHSFSALLLGLSLNLMTANANAVTVAVETVFATTNLIAGLNMVFRLTGIQIDSTIKVVAEIIPETLTAADCKIIQDPFILNNFLVKCLKEGTVSLKFTIKPPPAPDATTIPVTVVTYGSLTIKKLAGLKIADDPNSNPNAADILAGQQLFAAHCVTCHASKEQFLSGHQTKLSAITILAAINGGQPAMFSLSPQSPDPGPALSQDQVSKISVYLRAP